MKSASWPREVLTSLPSKEDVESVWISWFGLDGSGSHPVESDLIRSQTQWWGCRVSPPPLLLLLLSSTYPGTPRSSCSLASRGPTHTSCVSWRASFTNHMLLGSSRRSAASLPPVPFLFSLSSPFPPTRWVQGSETNMGPKHCPLRHRA